MFRTWRLGRVLGFPVEVNWTFLLLLAVMFLWFGGLVGVFLVLLAFASVLLHELGHAVVARKLRVPIAGIELSFFGGAAKMAGLPRSANHEIAIAAAGPAVSLILAGAGFALGSVTGVWLLTLIGWINLVIAGFNLIPALPMDGGRILRALLTRKLDYVRATDAAVSVARVAAVAFVVLGIYWGSLQLVILAPMLWLMGSRERVMARMMAHEYAYDGTGYVPRDVEVLGKDPFGYSRGGGYAGRPHRPFWANGGDRPPGRARRVTIRHEHGKLIVDVDES